ncbi:CRM-domain containing factor CFM2, chloroplastic-like [Vigna unguiculata]|uniref:CRM-domain containing factor CFM2, chloroplastic-like n=1 Tax=Vigna unguiculata TaxID=3917 RepID=UPI00101684E8|nr:CRM-domain containing factor CFM2, chloroplastic-like [Vigna unguiculata]
MLLPAAHFHFFHIFPLSSSSLHFFPLQFPITKTKFFSRCSATNYETGSRGSSAIEHMAEKLRRLGITESPTSNSSGGEIRVLFPHELPKQRGEEMFEPSWSTPLNPVPVPGSGIAVLSAREVERRRKRRKEELMRRKEPLPTLAELSLPDSEIRRLTTLGFAARRKVRLAKAGVTERMVNVIHELWKHTEVVRVFCEEFSRFDMRRTHDVLERKTGGLVVWRSGTKVILYRGTDYKYPNFLSDKVSRQDNTSDDASQLVNSDDKYFYKSESHLSESNSAACALENSNAKTAKPALILGVGTPNKVRFQLPDEAELAEDTDCLLMGLGPRFTDWWGSDPLPVDADLLPAVDPGYRKPFRLLPYGVNPKLTADEMTTLKRLGRPLPCHFALGRNRNLQGLAAAIIKLWERCEIAKIAVKRGVQNTSSKIMAAELKRLTGGILLSRDREFFALYRGKDYLSATMSSVIKKRAKNKMHEPKARNSSSAKVTPEQKGGTIECDSEVKVRNFQKDTKRPMLTKAELAIKRISIKLSMALEKKAKAEKILADLINAESPREQELDKEGITKEEKYMLRRIGLMMKPFLLLGRRGVFDGTVENMHLHWKYRELVKIICNGSLEDVHQISLTLEAESGGILVAVERVRKGFAIIVYRGKNYSAPPCLRVRKLLNKRQALKRSIEAQRRESYKRRILMLEKKINELKLQMVEGNEANSKQIVEAWRFDMATDKQEAFSNFINWNSPKEASVDNQQAIQEQPVELIDSGGINQGEQDNSVSWKSPREASVDNQQAIQEQPIELIDSGESHQSEQENSINWNSPTEASVDNQQALQEQPIELIDGCGAHHGVPKHSINWNSPKEVSLENLQVIQEYSVQLINGLGARQDEPKNSINWNSPKEASVDNLEGIHDQPDELIDSSGAHQGEPENFTSWNSSIKASISNLQAVQHKPVELIDGSGARRDEPESWPSLIHKETQLDEMSDSDNEHCISNSKAMEPSSSSSSKNDPEPSVPVINMSFPSRSLHLSTKERLLLRKQALKMKQPVVVIGKSNIVSSVVQAIKLHFEQYPLAIVNVKGRSKETTVQELVFKLEQETGSLLVSREPSNIILYRGWPADEPINAKNVNKMSKDRRITSNVSTGYTHRSRNTKRRISMIGRRRIGTRIGKRSIGRTSSRSNFNFRRNSSPIFSPSS